MFPSSSVSLYNLSPKNKTIMTIPIQQKCNMFMFIIRFYPDSIKLTIHAYMY